MTSHTQFCWVENLLNEIAELLKLDLMVIEHIEASEEKTNRIKGDLSSLYSQLKQNLISKTCFPRNLTLKFDTKISDIEKKVIDISIKSQHKMWNSVEHIFITWHQRQSVKLLHNEYVTVYWVA